MLEKFVYFTFAAFVASVANAGNYGSVGGEAAPTSYGSTGVAVNYGCTGSTETTVRVRVRTRTSLLAKMRAKRTARCSGGALAATTVAVGPSCSGQPMSVATPECNCEACDCSPAPTVLSPSVSVNVSTGVSATWGPPNLVAIALQSARYRAMRGIKGHCYIDMRHTSGVGWASHNSVPRTCFWERRNRGGYAAVRGADGWYSCLILN